MKLYRVHYWTMNNSSEGFDFFSNKQKAQQAKAKFDKENGDSDTDIDEYDYPISAKGLLLALNQLASSPQNG